MSATTGACLCGAVRWSSSGPVLWAGLCHCESCRRATSSPVTAFFGVPRNTLVWSGDLTIHETSEGRVRRGDCVSCGAQMLYQSEVWPDETHIFMPQRLMFSAEAPYRFVECVPWLQIANDLPEYPDSADATEGQ